MSLTSDATPRKDARLAMRLTHEQDALIRDAAAVTAQSLTEFVASAALARAQDTLADRRVFRLGDVAWTEFAEMLDRPGRAVTELSELLAEAAPWES